MKRKVLMIFLVFFLAGRPQVYADIDDWRFRGATVAGYYSGAFDNIYAYRTIDYLGSLGANSIALVVNGFQDDYGSIRIYRDEKATVNDAELIALIRYCHEKNLKVNLKPHLDIFPRPGNYNKWRALIAPSDTDAWFAAFTRYVLHYAQIAADNDVEMLTIGTEMVSMTRPRYLRYWQDIVAAVKALPYDGLITYCGDQSETFGSKSLDRRFWSLFDVISVSS